MANAFERAGLLDRLAVLVNVVQGTDSAGARESGMVVVDEAKPSLNVCTDRNRASHRRSAWPQVLPSCGAFPRLPDG